MMYQYFVHVAANTDEVMHLLANKREIQSMPFDTDANGKYYESETKTGDKAYLIIEDDKYMSVYY